jgi:undecaprenyl pyrophosphate synthase
MVTTTIVVGGYIMAVHTSVVGRFLELEIDARWLSTQVYTHFLVWKMIKELVLVTMETKFPYVTKFMIILKNMKRSKQLTKKLLVLCQFFHENHWFFELFEILTRNLPLVL